MSGDAARGAAYTCLVAVQRDNAYANLVMPKILRERGLRGRDAAFATELAYGALRMQGWYDAVIGHAAKRPVETINPEVRCCLWLGAHQVLAMRVPPHAAVSETVDMVREHGGVGAAKFANAVMRRITERDEDAWVALLAPGSSRTSLATRHSHPTWVADSLAESLGADGRHTELEAALAANNARAKVSLVARPGLVTQQELAASVPDAEPSPLSRYGVTLGGGDPASIPAVADGRAAVQDEGSQVVATALVKAAPVHAGERWLDMCAGPGGKAALLGALASGAGAKLDALELHSHRATLVRTAVSRLDPATVTVHVGDARTWGVDGSYDRVLLDAPCTGLGALRRRPEARWRRSQQDLVDLAALQAELLAAAARLVAPGGLVAYVTCSPVLAETRDIIERAVGLDIIDARPAMAAATNLAPEAWGTGPAVQMWTHVHGTDAMFLALLRRP
ncbi:MAG: methyltransferase [Actinobacteria bacterium HGW-Actinobacteria-4]|nr:MAG: methyltransferase [Actinobacteria bacterium HGW-Actinobacteria-4]